MSGAIAVLLYAFMVYTATTLSFNFLYIANIVLKCHWRGTRAGL
jgi:hypothetical protein